MYRIDSPAVASPARIALAATLLAGLWAPAVSTAQDSTFDVDDFVYLELHEQGSDTKEAQRCYSVIEDEDDPEQKALCIRLSKPLIRKDRFPILRTPAIGELPVGTYRVTVRMKVLGMLHSLGSAVAIQAGDQTREVWMNEFDAEDTYQEFTLDFESRPADIISRRDSFAWGAPGGVWDIVPLEQLPAIRENLERNDAPWIEQVSRGLAEQTVRRALRTPNADPTPYAEAIREHLETRPGTLYPTNRADQVRPLHGDAVRAINEHGRLTPDGTVTLSFPHDTTGQGVQGTRGPATPQPTLRRLYVDSIRVERLPEPDHLVMRELSTRYPWRRPGERQVFTLWLHNRSGAAREATLRLVLRSGLDHEEILREEPLSMPDGGYERLVWTWDIPADQRPWGQTVVAQVVAGGDVVSEARTWFAIHRYSNAVMIHDRPNTRRYHHPYASPPRTQNHRELVGANCTIYDSAGVVPEPEVFNEPYAVGNGSYMISIPTLASMTMGLAHSGIAPFYYLESNGSAKRAFEIFWDHPDWVAVMPANMDAFLINRDRDIQTGLAWLRGELKTEDNKPPPLARAGGAYSGQLVNMNGIVPENVDRVIEGSLLLVEHTAFAGVRWDGLPFRAHNSKALGGTWGKTQEELDAISVANLRRFRDRLRERFPTFELRANGGLTALEERQDDPYDFDRAFEILSGDPLHIELVRDHGSIMEEIWMHYAGFGTYANNCRNYLRASHFENAAFKMAGGHNGHMLWFYDGRSQYTPDEIYQQLFTFLGGAHLDGAFGPIPESIHELGVYAMRFAEFFWDPDLRPIRDMHDKVAVDADVDLWVAETGFQKTDEQGRMLYVLPVINPPVTELWLQNRFGLLPEPVREPIGLTVVTPDDYGSVHAVYLLENSPHPHVKPLEFEDYGDEVYFELPELQVFEVAVVVFAP